MGKQEMSLSCAEFKAWVFRLFGERLDELGFEVVREADLGGERCALVLESPDCSARFRLDRGVLEIHLGRRGARALWTEGPQGTTEWFAITLILDYLRGRPKPNLDQLLEESRESLALSSQEQLMRMAGLFEELDDEAFSLFRADSGSDRWVDFLRFYIDNEDLMAELRKRSRPAGE